MSLTHFADVWENSPAQGATYLVHLSMADLADGEGLVTASQADIAIRARTAVNTVQRSLSQLLDAHLIELVTPGRRGNPATYRLGRIFAAEAAVEALHVTTPDWDDEPKKALQEEVAIADNRPQKAVKPAIPMQAPVTLEQPPSPPRNAIPPVDYTAGLVVTLRILGTEPPVDTPLYWYRAEHLEAFKTLCYDLGCTPGELGEILREHQINAPGLRQIDDLRPMLKAAGAM